MNVTDKGNLFVIAAPSGTGKTSLVKAVVDTMPNITVSVSHTTRPKRPGETQGTNYYFVDKTEFQRMIDHQDFLEYASIFDHLYGTSKSWVEQTLVKGMDVILEIDWQGYQQIKHMFPYTIGVFILPPSLHDLQNRLVKRNQDHPEVIKKRLADVQETVSHIHEFDYVVINDDFAKAQHDLMVIIEAERLLLRHQTIKIGELIHELATKHTLFE
ncbi:MAG: guanylate kinase [Gammaproteobacteria bacterium]|nr:guanylate kinase [Gammaproteobacteria bacterium]MCW5583464.1 guanylate kinase [Gammaproteobacteria bacterium]